MKDRKVEIGLVVVFALANLAAPFVVGELYPFTISPMFCDQPAEYCTYEVLDPTGDPLPLDDFGLHLVYDGNPPGLGMGIEPRQTLHSFGCVASDQQIREHVQQRLQAMDGCSYVTVVCCHVSCGPDHRLVESCRKLRVDRIQAGPPSAKATSSQSTTLPDAGRNGSTQNAFESAGGI